MELAKLKDLVLDYVIFPVNSTNKRPITQWKSISKSPLFNFRKNQNYGIQTGKNNNIVVLDVDVKGGKKKIAQEFVKKYDLESKCNYIIRTISGGWHFYFKYEDELCSSLKPKINGISFIDFCSDGNYVVMEDSIIEGNKYECIKGNINSIDYIPQDIKDMILEWKNRRTTKTRNIKEGKYMEEIKYTDDTHLTKYSIEVIEKILGSDTFRAMAGDYSTWSLITAILKKYDLMEQWDNWSKTNNDKYNIQKNMEFWKSCNPDTVMADLDYIQFIYNLDSGEHIEIIENKIYDKITVKPKNTTVINRQYLPSMKNGKYYIDNEMQEVFNNKCVIIKASMGAGKTTLINEYIKDNDEKFISIVSRVSLSDTQYKTFSKWSSKYVHYSDRQNKNLDYYITTCDSLTHINLEDFNNRIVYLDEISSLLHYITMANHVKSKRDIFINFIHILNNSKQIICTDADVNDIVFKLFDMLDIEYAYIDNKYKHSNSTEHISYNNETTFFDNYSMVSEKEYTIFCADSKRKVDEARQILYNLNIPDDKILVITSDKTPLDTEKKLIDTDNWKDKYILYSPSIVYGIDFQPDKNLNVFCHVTGHTINPIQIMQQMFRCRKIENIHTCIKSRPHKSRFDCFDDVLDYYKKIDINEYIINGSNDCLNYIDDEETKYIFETIYMYYILADDLTKANYYKYITRTLEERNIETKIITSDIKKEQNTREQYDNKSELIENADLIIESILDGNKIKTFNPIVKRAEMLGLLNLEKNRAKQCIKKYKHIIEDDREYKKHNRMKYYLELVDEPDKIKNRYEHAKSSGYLINAQEDTIGKLELLRQLKYNDTENRKQTFDKLKKMTRLTSKEYDEKFYYKVLKHLDFDFIKSVREVKNKIRETRYKVDEDQLTVCKELIEIKKEAMRNSDYFIRDI